MWHFVALVRNNAYYRVTGVSMEPGIQVGDRLLVVVAAQVDYNPKRGDIVVVNELGEGGARFLKRLVRKG